MGAKTIAIANQKGGTGKTATTASLGIGLSKKGKRVLLIDADPQGDLSKSLGLREPDAAEVTLASHIKSIMNDSPLCPTDGIVRLPENADLMPANLRLAEVESGLFIAMNRERILSTLLQSYKDTYDYILIDCMPSLGLIPVNAFAAADSVLVPVSAEYLPAVGMTALLKTIEKVRRSMNPSLAVEGILLTLVDRRTRMARAVEDEVRKNYGEHITVFKSKIPRSIAASDATAAGMSIFEYEPSSKVAVAYESLCEEVIANE